LQWWHVIVEYWDGVPAYAGIIVDKHWSPRRQTLSCDTRTVAALLKDRFPFGIGSFFSTTFGVSSVSLRAAVSAVVARVAGDISVAPPQSWALPFDFPHLGEAGSFTRQFENEDWRTADEIISTIQKLPAGPDLAFIPKVGGNGWLRWDVLAGDPLIPGPTVDLPLSVRTSPASDVVMHEYGKDMISGLFVRGEGLDDRRPFGEAGSFAGPPMAVRGVAEHEVGGDLDLDGMAAAGLAKNRSPIEQFEIGALRVGDGPGAVPASSVRLGARFNARYSGDGYMNAFSEETLYVTGMSHTSSRPDFVAPEVMNV